MPETVIAVPVWDSSADQGDFTVNFVTKVLAFTVGDFALCVIDNASPYRRTRDFLDMSKDPRLKVIHNNENVGYGRALNQGIRWGLENGAQYFIAINNDVEVINPNWIEESFVKYLRENPKQLLGARWIDFNDNCKFSGKTIPYLEGWLLAFEKCFVDDVGLFDETFHSFFEDVDISMRAELEGYIVRQSPDFEWVRWSGIPTRGSLYHYYGCSTYKTPSFDWRKVTSESLTYFKKKWGLT